MQDKTNQSITLDRDAQINVVVNQPDWDEDEIDLGRIFHNMKVKSRVYAWVLLLCLAVGLCAPLLMYQFTPTQLTVSSVVTLDYEVNGRQVTDLTAPDGSALDLSQVTSSYVLQNALADLTLSQPITISQLRGNLKVERILTEESRQQQEIASRMLDNTSTNTATYDQVQGINLKYSKQFVVSLTNGFGEEDSNALLELKDEELRLVLDQVLAAYNDYLVLTYASVRLPDDEISVIDVENLDVMESLDQLRTATADLVEYVEGQTASIRSYRSWQNGMSLNDWLSILRTARQVNVEYIYSYVYTNSIVRNRDTMLTSYQYQLRDAQNQLATVQENIQTTDSILKSYKNDEIFVSMQESDSSRATRTTTDYYNNLVMQQATNYTKATNLEITIAELQDKIDRLSGDTAAEISAEVDQELKDAMEICGKIYNGIQAHMEEISESGSFTTLAEFTAPEGKTESFLSASMKKMLIGGAVGAVVALAFWFLAALAPEFRRNSKDEEDGKEAARA